MHIIFDTYAGVFNRKYKRTVLNCIEKLDTPLIGIFTSIVYYIYHYLLQSHPIGIYHAIIFGQTICITEFQILFDNIRVDAEHFIDFFGKAV